MSASSKNTTGYKIGSVSSTTGIPAVTIRMWERRYKAVEPYRSETGLRLYSDNDIQRLLAMRACVSAGDAISQVANLPLSELQSRAKSISPQKKHLTEPVKVVLLGYWLMTALTNKISLLDVIGRQSSLDDLGEISPELSLADLLIIEVDYLSNSSPVLIKSLRKKFPIAKILFIYRVASERLISQYEVQGLLTAKGPMSDEQLVRVVTSVFSNPSEPKALSGAEQALLQTIPERLFSESELAIQRARSNVVRCECPRHVTELIGSLNAFESYSENCANTSAADAQLHASLHALTAEARSLMESALQMLIEHEEI